MCVLCQCVLYSIGTLNARYILQGKGPSLRFSISDPPPKARESSKRQSTPTYIHAGVMPKSQILINTFNNIIP